VPAVKIILREPVDNLGERGDIVTVAPGYARNYLIPKGMAWTATPGNMKTVAHQRRIWAAKEIQEVTEAQARAADIKKLELKVVHKAGESGTLYGSVTKAHIVGLLSEKGITIDRRRIGWDSPIKSVGTFEIPVKLHSKVTASFKLIVEPEGGYAAPVEQTPDEDDSKRRSAARDDDDDDYGRDEAVE
jgi:large subunit ribosomal protein L9